MIGRGPPSATQEENSVPVPPLKTPESFPFPYAKPYDIQVDLMRVVFEAIECRKIAIVSDTGQLDPQISLPL